MTTKDAFKEKVAKIIKANRFLSLATGDKKGNVWVSPVNYWWVEGNRDFYFWTTLGSRHMDYLQKNSKVSFAIFDSRAGRGDVDGIQAEGIGYILKGSELSRILKIYNRVKAKNDTPVNIWAK